jgi:tRNA threonylcarbamoyladenosine biosynthesis protein TsaB
MNLLAVDTSTCSCSVAVMTGDRIASELTSLSSRTHTTHLMAMIRDALARAHTEPAALDGFAVTVGPGSFTGLRIGISTVKGLAFACGKPCVGISSLEALAAACPPHPYAICSVMDARKGRSTPRFSSRKAMESCASARNGPCPPRTSCKVKTAPGCLSGTAQRCTRS